MHLKTKYVASFAIKTNSQEEEALVERRGVVSLMGGDVKNEVMAG